MTGDSNGLIVQRNSLTHEVIRELEFKHTQKINSISMNNIYLFSSSDDNQIGVWSLETLEFITFIKNDSSTYITLTLSEKLIISLAKNSLNIIDISDWSHILSQSNKGIKHLVVINNNRNEFVTIDEDSINECAYIHEIKQIITRPSKGITLKDANEKLISIIKLPNYYIIKSTKGLYLYTFNLELMMKYSLLNEERSIITPLSRTSNIFAYFDQINTFKIFSVLSSNTIEENFSYKFNQNFDKVGDYKGFIKLSENSVLAINNKFIDFEVKVDIIKQN